MDPSLGIPILVSHLVVLIVPFLLFTKSPQAESDIYPVDMSHQDIPPRMIPMSVGNMLLQRTNILQGVGQKEPKIIRFMPHMLTLTLAFLWMKDASMTELVVTLHTITHPLLWTINLRYQF